MGYLILEVLICLFALTIFATLAFLASVAVVLTHEGLTRAVLVLRRFRVSRLSVRSLREQRVLVAERTR
jgi:hypothetical protein